MVLLFSIVLPHDGYTQLAKPSQLLNINCFACQQYFYFLLACYKVVIIKIIQMTKLRIRKFADLPNRCFKMSIYKIVLFPKVLSPDAYSLLSCIFDKRKPQNYLQARSNSNFSPKLCETCLFQNYDKFQRDNFDEKLGEKLF